MTTNPNWYMAEYRDKLRSKLKEHYGNICSICSGCICANEDLEFAHIQPTKLAGPGRGLQNRLLDIKANLHCYTLMGKKCHRAYDDR